MRCRTTFHLVLLLAGLTANSVAWPDTVAGIVKDPGGMPAANTFVTAEDGVRKMAVTVLTDKDGHYRIDGLFPGHYEMRARKAGYSDSAPAAVILWVRDATLDLTLRPDNAVHFSTPGAAWLNVLPDSPMKSQFITECTICHDQGSPLAHIPRDVKGWETIISKMRNQSQDYASLVTKNGAPMARWLARQHYGTKIAHFDPFAASAHVITDARITEYSVGQLNSWAHDVAVEQSTGLAWVGDYLQDTLTSIDPRTGQQTVYPAPMKGTGMHSLAFDREGTLWITFQLVHMVASFDTKTHVWRLYNGWPPGSLNHSFAVDSEGFVKKDPKGRLYVSTWGNDTTTLLDPKTGAVKVIRLPGPRTDKPYGIAVDSKGRIWYTKYTEDKMGFVDPTTGIGKEWHLPWPQSGPHRMHIDNKDNLWIPLSGRGSLLRYNTRNGTYKEFPLPDADSFPYDARYDSKSNRVWVTGNGGNAIYVFNPKTEQFQTFRMPAHLSYGRVLGIDYTTGDVWTSLASYPNKLSLRDHSIVVRIHHALDLIQ